MAGYNTLLLCTRTQYYGRIPYFVVVMYSTRVGYNTSLLLCTRVQYYGRIQYFVVVYQGTVLR